MEARPLGHLDWFYGGLRRWVENVPSPTPSGAPTPRPSPGSAPSCAGWTCARRPPTTAALDADDGTAATALGHVARLEGERDHLREALAAAEARLAGWPAVPDMNDTLDAYNELQAVVRGRLEGAATTADLSRRLRTTLAGVWLGLDSSGKVVEIRRVLRPR